MNIKKTPTFRGKALNQAEQAFGELRASDDVKHNTEELHKRFAQDGYLYIPGLLDRDQVLDARITTLRKLEEAGYLDPAYPLVDGIVKVAFTNTFMPELARENPPLEKLLYSGPMVEFYTQFLGGPIRHFDYTWCRAKPPSETTATSPHCDIVFMGRGTKQLYTSWTPLGDIPLAMGGLMILENSHRLEEIKSTYGQLDVDVYCTNYDDAADIEAGQKVWQDHTNGGAYSTDAVLTQSELGGRWLSANYKAGDVLLFGMYTMHASMDNHTNRIRLSTDTRYQLASEPVDERWVGETPIGHGPESKLGTIC